MATLRGLLPGASGLRLPLAAPLECLEQTVLVPSCPSGAGSPVCPSCHVARPTKDFATEGLPAGVSGPCFVQIHSRSTSSNIVPVFITILTVWSGLHVIDSMTLRICRAMRARRA